MNNEDKKKPWIEKYISTPAGEVPVVKSKLLFSDRVGIYKARWSIGREKFRVPPGLYAIGDPDDKSPVFLSANYKMSFDRLRMELGGIDGWIVVLDTKGINVWCAAGKGTFGTEEIVKRVAETGLDKVISHRKLIAPQLGAPGISAHKVKEQSGYRIVYGPVLAKDLPAFLAAGNVATPEMRLVRFTFYDRVVLIPQDYVSQLKFLFFIASGFLLLSGFGPGIYSFDRVATYGVASAVLLAVAYTIGMVFPQAFLPFIPGKSFSVKGAWVGLLAAFIIGWFLFNNTDIIQSDFGKVSWLFIIPSIVSFIAMNYTGDSTYTSLSGVLKEMKNAVPVQIISAAIGLTLWITGLFI